MSKKDKLREKIREYGLPGPLMDCSVDLIQRTLAKRVWELEHPDKKFPKQYDTMLAKDASKLSREEFEEKFSNENWIAETKLNGCRGLLIIKPLKNGKQNVRILSRRRSVKTFRYEEKQNKLPQFKDFKWHGVKGLTIIDGELYHPEQRAVTASGTQTESRLQNATSILNSLPSKALKTQKKIGFLRFCAFDVLYYNGMDLRKLHLEERKHYLSKFGANNECYVTDIDMMKGMMVKERNVFFEIIGFTRYFDLHKHKINKKKASFFKYFMSEVEDGEEGIMLKRLDSTYQSGKRSKDWYKMKAQQTFDAFVTGFLPGQGHLAGLVGSVRFSAYVNGEEKIIGKVGAFPLKVRQRMTGKNGKLKKKWYGKVAELRGADVTKNKRLFHCQLVRWRKDKDPDDCVVEFK